MRHFLLLLPFYCLLACNGGDVVEQTEGNMTDRYTVDEEGKRHGEFRRFFGKDTLAELSHYTHGMLEGERIIYNANGNPEIVEHYTNDILEGPYTVYFDDGKTKIEGAYDDGVMRGVWKRYFPNGGILEEVTYEENVENGPFKEYHENGKLKAEGHYLDGDFEQDSLFMYNDAGELERKMFCNHGVCNTVWLAEGVTE